jgi:hypothetical protein
MTAVSNVGLMIFGTLTLGFFIAVDMALVRERVIVEELSWRNTSEVIPGTRPSLMIWPLNSSINQRRP